MNRREVLKGSAVLALALRMKMARAAGARLLLFMGSRSSAPGEGLNSCFMNPSTGECTAISVAAEMAMPTALALSRDGRNLYAVSEVGDDGKSDGTLSAFRLDRGSGALTLLNQVSAGGGGPTTLAVDRTGRTLVVGSYGNGRTIALRLLPDGRLGEQTASMQDAGTGPTPRQSAPHVHCVVFSPDNRFVLAADFGADKLVVFQFDAAAGTLRAQEPAFWQAVAGSGPRQIAFHPNGKTVYLISELAATVTVFSWRAKDGALTVLQTISCFPEGYTGARSGAGVAVHPNGRFLYTTTRSDSSIQIFTIDPGKGTLLSKQRLDAGGKLPWSCTLDAKGMYLVVTNTMSNAAAVYRIDLARGGLTLVGSVTNVPSPVCALVVGV